MASGHGILIPLKYAGVLRRFSPELCGRLLLMALDFGESREEAQLPVEDPLSVVWALLQVDISEALDSYDRRVEGGRKGGKQGKSSSSKLKDTKDMKRLEVNRLDGNGKEENVPAADKPPAPAPQRKKFVPPSVEQVAAYIRERGSGVDAQRFVNFYASKGWVIGKSPMKDWKAAVRNWESREGKKTPAERDYTAPPGFDFLEE